MSVRNLLSIKSFKSSVKQSIDQQAGALYKHVHVQTQVFLFIHCLTVRQEASNERQWRTHKQVKRANLNQQIQLVAHFL